MGAREVAVSVVALVRSDDAYSNLILPDAIRRASLSPRDSGHATDLTYGALRWRGYVDSVLGLCVRGSLARVDDDVFDLLRVAGYELLIRQEPPHVINEWVSLAKKLFPRASGFVNGTLRTISRATPKDWRSRVVEGMSQVDARSALTSHPRWIVDVFTDLVGQSEVDALLDADNTPPVPTLIALPGLTDIPAGAIRTPYSPFGFRSSGGALGSVSGIAEGIVRVQDEGSQLAALALTECSSIVAGERWLDLCAGPGGKTALLASIGLPLGVFLTANERQPHRAELVRQSVKPFTGQVEVLVNDGRVLCEENPSRFDRILVDAPCTGLGALRRRPESRWRKSSDDLAELVPLQRSLLSAALGAVRVGGHVAYVTCSPHPAETTEVIDAVLAEHPEAERIDTAPIIEKIAPGLADARRGTAAQLYPHRHDTDAMFIQLIRRTR